MVGKVVQCVRFMTNAELRAEGWAGRVVAIEFTDGTVLFAGSDHEGNDAGSLMARSTDGSPVFVFPSPTETRAAHAVRGGAVNR